MRKGRAPAAVMTVEVRYHGVRKRSCGRFAAEIRTSGTRPGCGSAPLTPPRTSSGPTTSPPSPYASPRLRPTSPPILRLLSLPSAPPTLRAAPLEGIDMTNADLVTTSSYPRTAGPPT
ncbi:hypothetical protein B296_00021359 [Ensete ventricosum]|uniref:Uncharacterized protein n=1 Tax=Ensete ventricosum TaxID=4639 RepID=A0A427AYK4_ENSVE|nr:hypothetical protein B296_00021359 [Ensete ventricosum]